MPDKDGKAIDRINDSFRRANDIRYKEPKDLKPWQLSLFYEIKIREEIDGLEKEIEQQESTKESGTDN
jgi:hypothetical protein